MTTDLYVQHEGTVSLLHPATDAGREWLGDLDYAPWQVYAGGVAVEPRCVGAIIEGAAADGLVVEPLPKSRIELLLDRELAGEEISPEEWRGRENG